MSDETDDDETVEETGADPADDGEADDGEADGSEADDGEPRGAPDADGAPAPARDALAASALGGWIPSLVVGGLLLVAGTVGYLDLASRIERADAEPATPAAPDATEGTDAMEGAAPERPAASGPAGEWTALPMEATSFDWTCAPIRDEQVILDAMNRHGNDLFPCMASVETEGEAMLDLEIGLDATGAAVAGRVRGVFAGSSAFTSCAARALAEWRSVSPSGGCAVVPILLLAPGDDLPPPGALPDRPAAATPDAAGASSSPEP